MSTSTESELDRCAEEADRWAVRLSELERGAPEWKEFVRWLHADGSHLAAFSEAWLTWLAADSLREPGSNKAIAQRVTTALYRIRARPSMPGDWKDQWHLGGLRVLGVLLLIATAMIIGLWLFDRPERHQTGVGKFDTLQLPDGSVVRMNTDTIVQVDYSASERNIALIQGEALFKVTPDPQRPFRVSSAGMIVQALGTEFIVRKEADERMQVLVRMGKVELVPSARVSAAQGTDSSALGEATLSAGDIGTSQRGRISVARFQQDEVNRRLAWTRGKLSFRGEPLERVAAEFNRYNRRRIVIADPSLAQEPITGSFRATDPQQLVSLVQSTLGARELPSVNVDEILLVSGKPRVTDRRKLK